MAKSKRKRVPKTILKLPDLEQSKSVFPPLFCFRIESRPVDYSVPKLSIDGFRFCSSNDWCNQSFSIDRKSGFTSRKATAIPIIGREYSTVAVASNT